MAIRKAVLPTLLLAALWATSAPGRAAPADSAGATSLVARFASLAHAPSSRALDAALSGYHNALALGTVANPRYLTLIDYSLPSVKPRLWILDLERIAIVRNELVAHGRGSGDTMATSFSNDDGSHKSSLGLFVTDQSYVGAHGYSLRLRGLEPGVNDHAYDRAIVVHGAPYVSDATARAGRLGRSWGCPAVRPEAVRAIIDTIKGGTVLYAYHPAV